MALLNINGTRPEKIIVNGEGEAIYLYINEGDTSKCIWSKRLPAEKLIKEGGSFTVERKFHINQEDNTKYLSDGTQNVYVYAGDTLKITATPATNYELDTIVVTLYENQYHIIKTFTSITSPFEVNIDAYYAKPAKNVTITALFKVKEVGWHTIWTGSHNMRESESSSSYTTDIYKPNGYQSISDPTKIRVTAKLYKKTKTGAISEVKVLSAVTGNQIISVNSTAQYLDLLTNGIQSRVKSTGAFVNAVSYYWGISKIEQYY